MHRALLFTKAGNGYSSPERSEVVFSSDPGKSESNNINTIRSDCVVCPCFRLTISKPLLEEPNIIYNCHPTNFAAVKL